MTAKLQFHLCTQKKTESNSINMTNFVRQGAIFVIDLILEMV